jgi:hypothetical protein
MLLHLDIWHSPSGEFLVNLSCTPSIVCYGVIAGFTRHVSFLGKDIFLTKYEVQSAVNYTFRSYLLVFLQQSLVFGYVDVKCIALQNYSVVPRAAVASYQSGLSVLGISCASSMG